MKKMPNSNRFCYSSRLLLNFLVMLLGVGVLLVGLTAISKTFAAPIGSPRAESRSQPLSSKNDRVNNSGAAHRLDEQGNRPATEGFVPLHVHESRPVRPAGNGAWSSLGPPGGDVFDAAVSTVTPSIALAGIAPDGSFGALYRSSDGGATWSEMLALRGTSVFDIEFAPSGTAYIGTQDSIRRSTDAGVTWMLLNLGIGLNDQVFDVALDPSNQSTLWAGIADATGAQPVNVMRSTDSGATWSNRTPPLAQPISCRGIAVDPNDSNTVIAAFGGDFGGGEVWVSTDGGDSWTDRSAGLPGNPLNAVVYDGTRLLVGGRLLFGSQFVG